MHWGMNDEGVQIPAATEITSSMCIFPHQSEHTPTYKPLKTDEIKEIAETDIRLHHEHMNNHMGEYDTTQIYEVKRKHIERCTGGEGYGVHSGGWMLLSACQYHH